MTPTFYPLSLQSMTRLFDDLGFPVPEAIKTIKEWPIYDMKQARELLCFTKIFHNSHCGSWLEIPDYRVEDEDPFLALRISTDQFAGNEMLISALQANILFWHHFWHSTRRGGIYVFNIDKLIETENDN